MGQKREISGPLRSILDWDIAVTKNFVKMVDTKFGPLSKYKTHLKGLEISCHGIPWLVGTASLIFLINSSAVRQLFVNIFIALILDIIVVAVVKAITRRRRPSSIEGDMLVTIFVDKFSFPSGHATRAVMLAILLPLEYELLFPVTVCLIGWSLAVCVSRILLLRHHILDVIGGFVIGFLEAFVIHLIWLSPESAQWVVNFFLDETQVGASFDV